MEEYNKSYGANNHTSLLSHAQSQSPNLQLTFSSQYFLFLFCNLFKWLECSWQKQINNQEEE